MSTRLLQIVSFTNVAASVTVPLPHDININGIPKKPDFVAATTPGFTIAVTETTVTVTNTNDTAMDVDVWLELKHSIPRELGGDANLDPQPFIASPGSSAGGSPTIIVQEEGVPLGGNPFTTLDFVGGGVTAANAGGGVASVTVPTPATPAIDIQDEGTPVAGGPFTALNFVGAGVTASDGGGGVADVTIPGGGGSYPDITDNPGVEVAIATATTVNANNTGFPFPFTVNALNRANAFFIRDQGPNNVRAFFDSYCVFGIGFAYFSVDGPVLVAGPQTISVNNTCQAFAPTGVSSIQGFTLAASAAGYASQGLCMLRLVNYGPNPLTLNHDDPGAPGGSRMLFPGGANLVMPVNGFVELQQFQVPSASPNRAWICTSKNF